MPVTLWRFTKQAEADAIMVDGFRDDQGTPPLDGYWFAPEGDTHWRAAGTVLVEVALDVAIHDLEPYANPYLKRTDYLVPAAFLNAHTTAVGTLPHPDESR